MLNNLLANSELFEERSVEWTEAGLYAALGFAIVFVGIILLICIVWAIGKIMNPKKKPLKEQANKTKEVEKPKTLPITRDEGETPDEVVAVIMAALMAYYQTNNPKCEFTVKRIKKI